MHYHIVSLTPLFTTLFSKSIRAIFRSAALLFGKLKHDFDLVHRASSRFQNDKRQLPVLWHQALLTFVQRYKSDIASEQKEALLELLKAHTHHEITNEVRRELVNSKSRDLENEDENSQHSMDLNFAEEN